MTIKLKKENGGYLALHGADFYWYTGTVRQAYCFADVEDARKQYKEDLSGWKITDINGKELK